MFIDYARLCAEDAGARAGAGRIAGVDPEAISLSEMRAPMPRLVEGASAALVREAREVHTELSRRAARSYGSATG
ncbi:MAG: hypothetical protein WDN44_10760 [Sphingomonas sp.]